jgi:hypothetical protein
MKNVMKHVVSKMTRKIGLFLFGLLFLACGSGPSPASAPSDAPAPAPAPVLVPAPDPSPAPASAPDELDAAIRETSDYLNKQLPKGNKLVILNFQSEYPALSEYVIDELIANTVNDRVFSVVDRQQLNTIRAELDFQMSGEVDDNTAQTLGRMAGAQIIVSGAVSRIGDLFRLRVRALSVESARIEGQFNRNIPDGPTVAALVKSQATGYGGSNYSGTAAAKPAAVAPAGAVPALAGQTAISAPTPAPAPAPAAPAPTPPPVEKVYKIGDTGPAGGIVFYDKGNSNGGWRYLEAAPANTEFTAEWGPRGSEIKGTATGMGSGKRNTEVIVNYLNGREETGRAAQLWDALLAEDNWFLPSKDELNLMYINLKQKGKGNFQNVYYWSSSEYSDLFAWAQNFSNGTQDTDGDWYRKGKISVYSVRAARRF